MGRSRLGDKNQEQTDHLYSYASQMEIRVSSWIQEYLQEASAFRLRRSPTLVRGEPRERSIPEAR